MDPNPENEELPIIDVTSLRASLERDEVTLIDVLPRVSYDKQHLPGAIHISFYEEGFVERVLAQVDDKSTRIVVYCLTPSCNASSRAARALIEAGFDDVLDFEGGLREWEAAGLDVVR